jgi:hypothetical protein
MLCGAEEGDTYFTITCNQLRVVLVNRFISDTANFIATASTCFTRLPESAAAPSHPPPRTSEPRVLEPAQGLQGNEGALKAANEQAQSSGSPQPRGSVTDITMTDVLLIVPEQSWSRRSFAIVMPCICVVPNAAPDWISSMLRGVQAECAPTQESVLGCGALQFVRLVPPCSCWHL